MLRITEEKVHSCSLGNHYRRVWISNKSMSVSQVHSLSQWVNLWPAVL